MKKIVLFVSLDEKLMNQSKHVIRHINLHNTEIHLFHCHKIQVYMNELSIYSYPASEQFPEMEKATNIVLEQFAKEAGFKNYVCQTVFDSDPKDRAVKYLEDVNAELAVVATKGASGFEGIFESSFASYLKKFSPSDILILRPER